MHDTECTPLRPSFLLPSLPASTPSLPPTPTPLSLPPFPCGTTTESRTHIVEECEICKEERDALEEMRKLDVRDMEEFGRLESSEKTIAILEDR